MKYNLIKFLATVIAGLLVCISASAHSFESNGIYYNITSSTNKTVEVTFKGYYSDSYSNEYTGAVNIPSEVTNNDITYSVTSIGDYAFDYCTGLTEVTIPNSVTSIGYSAFDGCRGLTSVTIGNSVTSIGSAAFHSCYGLTEVTIPNSVTSIGVNAFEGCSGLTEVTIPNSVTEIGHGAFRGCSGLIGVYITSIEAWCNIDFDNSYSNPLRYSNKLYLNDELVTNLTIPNSVTSIGDYAFYECPLYSVTIGSGVLSIGVDSFGYDYYDYGYTEPTKTIWLTNTPPDGYSYARGTVNYVANDLYTSLSNVTVYPYLSSMFEVDGVKYVPVSPSDRTCDAIDCSYSQDAENINLSNTVSYKGITMTLKDIKPYSFYENQFIKDVKIDYDGNIGSRAFYDCNSISGATINIYDNTIGNYAFYDCSALESATIEAETIGNYAFYGCSALEAVILKDGVVSIGYDAFRYCKSLQGITIPNSVTSLGEYCFSGCSSLGYADIGTGITEIERYTFYDCSSLPEISIPKNVVSIGNYVFRGCSSLADVAIEDRETELALGSNGSSPMFADCPLNKVYIGGNISYSTSSSYGYSPFYRNTTLETVVITDKETEISPNEFYGCTNLKNMTMGDGVETIGNWAFSGCSSLDYFQFGSGMKTIGEEAFSDCTAMTKLISNAEVPPICGIQALDDINKWTCELFIPDSSIDAYKAADQWKEFFFITTEIEDVDDNLSGIKISHTGDGIVIFGAEDEPVEIFTVGGSLICRIDRYDGAPISLPAGIYIARINGKSLKVAI